MLIIEDLIQIVMRLPMWAGFSLPLLLPIWGLYYLLKNSNWHHWVKVFVISIFTAIILAPMPIGIFLAFIPNGYLMFGGLEYYSKVDDWLIKSIVITFTISGFIFNKLLKPEFKSIIE